MSAAKQTNTFHTNIRETLSVAQSISGPLTIVVCQPEMAHCQQVDRGQLIIIIIIIIRFPLCWLLLCSSLTLISLNMSMELTAQSTLWHTGCNFLVFMLSFTLWPLKVVVKQQVHSADVKPVVGEAFREITFSIRVLIKIWLELSEGPVWETFQDLLRINSWHTGFEASLLLKSHSPGLQPLLPGKRLPGRVQTLTFGKLIILLHV